MPSFHRLCPALATAALALALGGCSNVSQLRLDDNSAPVASLRATHRLGGGPGGAGLELDVQAVRGKGTQALGATETVVLDPGSISGPRTLNHDVRTQHLQLAYNHRLFAGSPVEFEWFAGAALHRIDWTTTANPGDPTLQRRNTWWGPAGGVAGRFNLSPMLALELRYGAAVEYTNLNGVRNSTELALALTPSPAVALRVGVADTRSALDPGNGDSDLVLRVRGPFLGLALQF